MKTRGWTMLILVVLGTYGCSSGSGGSGGAPGGSAPGTPSGNSGLSYCDTACSKLSTCDASADFVTCRADCTNETAAIAPKLRAEYVSALSACYTAKDCATVIHGNATDSCSDQASASLAPTPAGTSFCGALNGAFDKCGTGSVDVAACFTMAKQYNDQTLAAAQSCTAKACDEIGDCVNAQLGIEVVQHDGNSCTFAFDGECDEPNVCAYGTDTYDCT